MAECSWNVGIELEDPLLRPQKMSMDRQVQLTFELMILLSASRFEIFLLLELIRRVVDDCEVKLGQRVRIAAKFNGKLGYGASDQVARDCLRQSDEERSLDPKGHL